MAKPKSPETAGLTPTEPPKKLPKQETQKQESLKKRVKTGEISPEEYEQIEVEVLEAKKLAQRLDDSLIDPITGMFGLDAAGGIASAYLIWKARKTGISRWKMTKMAARTGVDTIIGSIPILGDIFDFVYKGNKKNMVDLEKHFKDIERKYKQRRIDTREKNKVKQLAGKKKSIKEKKAKERLAQGRKVLKTDIEKNRQNPDIAA